MSSWIPVTWWSWTIRSTWARCRSFSPSRHGSVRCPSPRRDSTSGSLRDWLEAGERPRIVHTVSNFHHPAGVSASDSARRELAHLADRYGFLIVEDDPYGRLRFHGGDVEPIAAHSDQVARLGSASKVLAPALRVGWMSGPPEVIALVERLPQSVDLCGSTFSQMIVAELFADRGWFEARRAHTAGVPFSCRWFGIGAAGHVW